MDFPGLNTNMYMLQANHELEVIYSTYREERVTKSDSTFSKLSLQIAVKPQLIYKPGGLQHRNKENELVPVCIRENESPLEYFSIYRYSNCYANCRMKAMIQLCGCLPYIYYYVAEFYNITVNRESVLKRYSTRFLGITISITSSPIDFQRCEIERLHCIQENAKLIAIVRDVENENVTCSCRTPCENMNYDGFPNSFALMQTSSP